MKTYYFAFLAFIFVCTAEDGKEIGAVASDNKQATEVGKMILQQGGNAFDAVVAMAYAMGVVESGASGIGGGGFAVLYDANSEKIKTIDGREEAPGAYHPKVFCMNEDCYLNPDCECSGSDDIIGWSSRIPGGLSVGVPGMVSMTRKILEEHGTMTLEEVIAPAIKLAEEGFIASERWIFNHAPLEGNWWVDGIKMGNEDTINFLYNEDGSQKYSAGDIVVNQNFANTLKLIVEDPDSMYTGELAQEIVDAVKATPNTASGSRPGLMEMSDLAAYKAVEREPLAWEYGGYKIYGHGMCSSGPMTIAMVAQIIKAHMGEIPSNAYDNEEFIHALISAQNIAWGDRNAYMGDNDFSGIDVDNLMLQSYLEERAELIGEMMVPTPVEPGNPNTHMKPTDNTQNDHGTSHLAAIDADGNIASMTSTIEMSFGSGIMVPGRGFFLNNQLTDFEGYGFMDDGTLKANAPEGGKKLRSTAINGGETTLGGKRPRSSTSPMIILKNNKPYAALGGVGGSTIIGSAGNSLFRMLFEGKNADVAIDAPRVWARGGNADIEEELYDSMAQTLIDDRGYILNDRRVYEPHKFIRIAIGVNIDDDGIFHAGEDTKRLPGASGMVVTEMPETSSTEEPEEPGMYTVADGKNPCSEETIILDAEVCEMAAIELSLTFVSKFEDKTSRMGCFLSEGFGGGVYYNSHEDASYSDDKDYKSVCKTEMEMTAEPTKIPTMRTERPSTSTMEPTMMTKEPTMMTKEPTMMTKEPTMMTQEPTMMTTEVETTSGPDCEGVCQSDLEKVEEDLKAVESDVAYLINDVPEVLANTFTTVNNLEKMVEDLMKEVERLTALVDDHSARFSCLAAFDEDKMVEQKAF